MKLKDQFISNFIAILFGILVSFLLLLFLKVNPAEVFAYAVSKLISDRYNIAEIFVKATPLILSALAFAFTFKASLFNIGAQGQFYAGSIVAVAMSLAVADSLPPVLTMLLILIASSVAAGAVGAIIGFLKAKFQANEFLISMMSTYVVIALMDFLLRTVLREAKGEYPQTDSISKALHIPILLKGTRLHLGFILAVFIACGIWFLLYKTKLGFKIRATGSNATCAKYAGFNASRIIVISFLISGALAGIAGFTEVNGVQHMLIQDFNAGVGAAGIGIAILANAHPIGIIFASLLFGALSVLGNIMGRMPGMNIPSSIIEIMQGSVMIFVIIAYFAREYVEGRREKEKMRKVGQA